MNCVLVSAESSSPDGTGNPPSSSSSSLMRTRASWSNSSKSKFPSTTITTSSPLAPFVTDLHILSWGERAPANSYSIPHSLGFSRQVFLERDWTKPPLTSVVVYFPARGEQPVAGYKSIVAVSPNGPKIALYSDEDAVCPIVNVSFMGDGSGGSGAQQQGWTLMDRTPLGFKAQLDTTAYVVAIKFDTRDLQRFACLNNDVTVAAGEEDSRKVERRSSFIELLSLPHRSSTPTQGRRDSHSPETTLQHQLARTANTRLQQTRKRVLAKVHTNAASVDGLAFDPEVAALLLGSPALLERSTMCLMQITKASLPEALAAMHELNDLVQQGHITPSVPATEQMTMFDFLVAYGANQAMARSLDVLAGPACEVVVRGSALAEQGMHPVALHYALSTLWRCSMLLDSLTTTTTVFATGTITAEPSRKLLFNHSSLSASSTTYTTTTTCSSSSRTISAMDLHAIQDVHGINAEAAFLAVFTGLVERAAAASQQQDDDDDSAAAVVDAQVSEAMDNIVGLMGTAPLHLESSLQIHLYLQRIVPANMLLIDLLFAVIWLTANWQEDSTQLRQLLVMAARNTTLETNKSLRLVVRRIVFPVMMQRCGSNNTRAWTDVVELITELWKHYRKALKAEFVVFFHTVITPKLKSQSEGGHKLLQMLSSWMEVGPLVLVEMYLNLDLSTIPDWKRFQDLIGCVCDLAMVSSSPTAAAAITKSALKRIKHESKEETRSPRYYALSILVSISRHLVNLCGTVQLNKPAWQNNMTSNSSCGGGPRGKEMEVLHFSLLTRALELGKGHGGAKSAVEFLLAAGHLEHTPKTVCKFLRLFQNELGAANVGDYLGEGGRTAQDQAFMSSLRDVYVKTGLTPLSKTETLDQALRRFLTQSGFRLPGEAQKIERLLDAFARRFAMDHADVLGLSAESVLLLAFALVMLNTDLHKPQIKRSQKMRKEDFVRNLRGGNDNGSDFPSEFLEQLYDSIRMNPIQLDGFVTVSAASDVEPALAGSTSNLVQHGLSLLSTIQDQSYEFYSTVTNDCANSIFKLVAARLFFIANHLLIEEAATVEVDLFAKALDLVEYVITCTLFLQTGTTPERRAFSVLLNTLSPNDEFFTRVLDYLFEESTVGDMVNGIHAWCASAVAHRTCVDHVQKLAKLAQRINYPKVANCTARVLVQEGVVSLLPPPCTLLFTKERTLFLLSDCLLVYNAKLGAVEWDLPLRTLRAVSSSSPLDDDVEEEKEQHLEEWFELCSPLVHFSVRAKSRRERDAWVTVISQTSWSLTGCSNSARSYRQHVLPTPPIHPPAAAPPPPCTAELPQQHGKQEGGGGCSSNKNAGRRQRIKQKYRAWKAQMRASRQEFRAKFSRLMHCVHAM